MPVRGFELLINLQLLVKDHLNQCLSSTSSITTNCYLNNLHSESCDTAAKADFSKSSVKKHKFNSFSSEYDLSFSSGHDTSSSEHYSQLSEQMRDFLLVSCKADCLSACTVSQALECF